ncbi:hypothetical protein [Nocardioides sp. GXZ039]|uniref:hypothetical protein n=1 Tax=Nocardioides sp. GXZ039 TaxID=3136018 RepID=UPI0030F49DC4
MGDRRRWRWVVVGAVLVLAVAAVAVTLRLRAEPDPSEEPPTGSEASDVDTRVVGPAADGWQTLEVELPDHSGRNGTVRVLVDVPGQWARIDAERDSVCGFYSFGADPDDCGENEVVAVYDNALSDYAFGSGLRPAADYDDSISSDWLGHVSVGGIDVTVASDDRDVALRVLGSARPEGQTAPDLTGAWADVEAAEVSYPVPPAARDDLQVDVRDRSGPRRYAEGEQTGSGRWRAVATVGRSDVVATAATRALAELVAGSARRTRAG